MSILINVIVMMLGLAMCALAGSLASSLGNVALIAVLFGQFGILLLCCSGFYIFRQGN